MTTTDMAKDNIVLDSEKGRTGTFTGNAWAGAWFQPVNGNWLFANIQSPGISFAITGPCHQGAL